MRAMSGEAAVSVVVVEVVRSLAVDDEQPDNGDVEHASNRRGQAGWC